MRLKPEHRQRARKLLLRAAFGVPGLILAAVVGQYAIQLATDKGLYQGAGRRFDNAVTAILSVLTSPVATHIAALMLGIAIALLLDIKVFKPSIPEDVGPPPALEEATEAVSTVR